MKLVNTTALALELDIIALAMKATHLQSTSTVAPVRYLYINQIL